MNQTLTPAAFLVALAVFTLTLLGVGVVAPHDAYYRWQAHTSGTTRKADWIYERLHFDPAPVDVALVGTSRMGAALSAGGIEDGYCRATGRRIHVANLSIPETGRNMHYVIAKEALEAKRPALVVVEMNEYEPRRPHRGFVMLADAGDVLAAPMLVNTRWLADIARLPGRQIELFLRTLTGAAPLRRAFDPSAYAGSDLDRTREIVFLDGRRATQFVRVAEADLDAERDARRARASEIDLPEALAPLEHRLSRLYLARIGERAGAAGARVDTVFLPAWREPAVPAATLAAVGLPAVDHDLGGAIASDAALWRDAAHMNAWGAEIATARFAASLADAHPALGVAGCTPRAAYFSAAE